MRAYVKTTKGNFPNVNFWHAWKGLTELQYEVIKFEEEELWENGNFRWVTKNTPVFAGVSVFDDILVNLGVDYKKIDTYPKILKSFLNRDVELTTLGAARIEWDKVEEPRPITFMKPVGQKQFTGKVMKSILDWIPLTKYPNETPVYVSAPVKFLSEYRIYIRDQKILIGKHYSGDWSKGIDIDVVRDAITTFTPEAPCAYALDFGLTDEGQTSLVEFNDATSLGNYGLDSLRYADMLVSRWNEICGNV